ncbi:MAG: helicase-exonuclease AddAB subunit AddB [Clostridia bacterium]|nr:helicase-exonuclease AddAB subunit AddB [Clostridia bacterium]
MSVNIIIGRADKDLNQYMYERVQNISNQEIRKTYILVPEQYTLQAEKTAVEKLQVSGLMDIEVLSFSRLSHYILDMVGGVTRVHVNEQGKHMILYKILTELEEELQIFGKAVKKHGFIDLINELITEMKQFNILSEELMEVIIHKEDEIILTKKILDICKVYEKFNDYLKDKYIDSEDFINMLIDKINDTLPLKNSVIWIDGFDHFNPQILTLIGKMMGIAHEINFNFTMDPNGSDQDLFDVTKYSVNKCIEMAQQSGVPYQMVNVQSQYQISQVKEIQHLEKNLYAYSLDTYENKTENIDLYGCSSYYAEVETVASKIIELVRTRDYRYKDIAIICNDMDSYDHLIQRVFEEYDIPVFIDTKKTIMHNPFVEYIMALMDVISNGYRYEDVFRFLKTGQSDYEIEACETLENYAIRYKIKGNKWKKDFEIGREVLGDEAFEQVNMLRSEIIGMFEGFERVMKKAKTVSEKTEKLYDYIQNKTKTLNKVENWIERLRGLGEYSYMRETAQIWNIIINILDQMVELIGDTEINNKDFTQILRAGLESVEAGIIPTTMDQVIAGTLQRSKIANVKALFMMGVNDGVIPSCHTTDGVLLREEKEILKEYNVEMGRDEAFKIKEEKLLIYKAMSKSSEYLSLSYTVSDAEGKEMKPSLLIDRVMKMFKNLSLKKDILDQPDGGAMVTTPKSTLKYLIEQIRHGLEGEPIPELWQNVHNWYVDKEEYKDALRLAFEGLFYNNQLEKLSWNDVKNLYNQPMALSASRLETFVLCPYAYFLRYGIKAEERKIYDIAVAEIGEIYHQTLMAFSKKMSNGEVDIEALERYECEEIINQILEDITNHYLEGILKSNNRYLYKILRIRKVLKKTAWMLVEHLKKGTFNEFYYEVSFGRKGIFPPIQVILPNEETVYIEGRIDRIDVLNKDEELFIKIIDYKSGGKQLDLNEVVNGLQLQLMVYLQAALEGIQSKKLDKNIKPAGIFYFKIDNPMVPIDSTLDEESLFNTVEKQIRKMFKMDGLVLKDSRLIKDLDKDIQGYSDIIPVNIKKNGDIGTKSKVLGEEAFHQISVYTEKLVKNICMSITQGSIDIQPKKLSGKRTSCTFCKYKTICNFDTSFPNNKYERCNKIKTEDVLTAQ